MAIRSKSRKKENSATTSERKRQPFGLIEDGESRKTSIQKRKKERRKSRQIGDDVILFIQERNSKKKTLHRATVDPKTGGITYTPANRKTPIAYDRHRHTLIETTPDGDQIELELDCDEEKENIDSTLSAPVLLASKAKTKKGIQTIKVREEESSCAPKEEKRITRRGTGTLQPTRSYAESTDPERSDSSSSDDEEESGCEAVPPEDKSATTSNRNIVASSKKKGKVEVTTKARSDEESELDEPPVKKSKVVRIAAVNTKNKGKKTSAAAASKTMSTSKKSKRHKITTQSDDSDSDAPAPRQNPGDFSSPIVKSNWEEQPDWRCTGAIDY